MISTSNTTVIGFSLSGATFDGCGVMVKLDLIGESNGFSELIIASPNGDRLDFSY